MRKVHRIALSLLLAGCCFLGGRKAFAVDAGDLSWGGYARSNFQYGDHSRAGETLQTGGWGFHPRLQEGSYIESVLTAKLPEDSKFILNIAYGGPWFHYTDAFATDTPAIRELYLDMGHIAGRDDLRAWFGSRLYAQNPTSVAMPVVKQDGTLVYETADMTSSSSMESAMLNAGMSPAVVAATVQIMMLEMH